MNSMSKCSCALRISTPQSVTLPLTAATGDEHTIPKTTVASLKIDTTRYQNPCIKIDYTTVLNTISITAGVIVLQVYKQYDGQLEPEPVGDPWTFSPISATSRSVTIFVPDCTKPWRPANQNCCSGCQNQGCCPQSHCCTYTVQLKATGITTAADATPSASLVNSTVAVSLASSGMDCCNQM